MRCFLCLTALLVGIALPTAAQVNVTTYHNDKQRTGHNIKETILTPANVNSTQFGKLFSQAVDGFIYGQPLYMSNVSIAGGTHNVVYVATMHDSVYAFDADSNSGSNANPLWKVNFTDPANGITTVSTADVSCSGTISEIGILSTPVIDTYTGTLYVVARTKENGVFYQRLHALNIKTGAEKFGGPVTIQASVAGIGNGSVNGMITFDPLIQNQRAALLLQNGVVYIAWGSHCDNGAYHGWLMAYDKQTLAQKAVWLTTPNADGGAIWQSGSGPAADSAGNIYVSVANGGFDVDTGGVDYGQSIAKLSPPTNGILSVVDYFEPFNGETLNGTDRDIGSGGVVIVPDQPNGPHVHLLVQGDKAGNIYLIDRDNMGSYNSQSNDQIVQYLAGATTGMWNTAAWWNNRVYFGPGGDSLKCFTFSGRTGLLSTTPSSQTSKGYGYPGSTPSISANGSSNGILWMLDNVTYKTTDPAILHAYDATNLANELYKSSDNATRDSAGPAVKFQVPTIANGKVYIGTQTQLSVYGLLSAK